MDNRNGSPGGCAGKPDFCIETFCEGLYDVRAEARLSILGVGHPDPVVAYRKCPVPAVRSIFNNDFPGAMARERMFKGVDHQLRHDQPLAHGNVGRRHAFVYDDLDREHLGVVNH